MLDYYTMICMALVVNILCVTHKLVSPILLGLFLHEYPTDKPPLAELNHYIVYYV